jgi:hypothetical protein
MVSNGHRKFCPEATLGCAALKLTINKIESCESKQIQLMNDVDSIIVRGKQYDLS